jgi:hypothetical protein
MKPTTANANIASRRLRNAYGVAPLADGLLTPAKAQAFADAFTASQPNEAVAKRFDDVADGFWYITLDAARFWVASMSVEARCELFDCETLMGWFVEECGDESDADGDFCSTPGCDGEQDFDDIMADMANCSRAGLLMVEVPGAGYDDAIAK